jgi:hypothetical protein
MPNATDCRFVHPKAPYFLQNLLLASSLPGQVTNRLFALKELSKETKNEDFLETSYLFLLYLAC